MYVRITTYALNNPFEYLALYLHMYLIISLLMETMINVINAFCTQCICMCCTLKIGAFLSVPSGNLHTVQLNANLITAHRLSGEHTQVNL